MTKPLPPLTSESSYARHETRSSLSQAEQAVLGVFRKYLMSPGKMLCFSNDDLQSQRAPLASLSRKGFLVKESFRGGYTLTETGFAVMRGSR